MRKEFDDAVIKDSIVTNAGWSSYGMLLYLEITLEVYPFTQNYPPISVTSGLRDSIDVKAKNFFGVDDFEDIKKKPIKSVFVSGQPILLFNPENKKFLSLHFSLMPESYPELKQLVIEKMGSRVVESNKEEDILIFGLLSNLVNCNKENSEGLFKIASSEVLKNLLESSLSKNDNVLGKRWKGKI